MYTGDLLDHHSLEISNLPSTVKELYVDDILGTEKSLMRFQDLGAVHVYMFVDIIKESFYKVPNIYNILTTFKNLKVLSGISSRYSYLSRARYHNDIIDPEPGLSLHELMDFETLHFSKLSTNQFLDIWDFEKRILIALLSEMRIDHLIIPRLSHTTCQNLIFSRKDILRMSTLNIFQVSTEVLENAYDVVHPWPELRYLKKLQRIIISPGTALNLIYLHHLFTFNAIQIGDYGEKISVSDINVLQKLLKEKIDCPKKSIWEQYDIWTFTMYDDITIFLNNGTIE